MLLAFMGAESFWERRLLSGVSSREGECWYDLDNISCITFPLCNYPWCKDKSCVNNLSAVQAGEEGFDRISCRGEKPKVLGETPGRTRAEMVYCKINPGFLAVLHFSGNSVAQCHEMTAFPFYLVCFPPPATGSGRRGCRRSTRTSLGTPWTGLCTGSITSCATTEPSIYVPLFTASPSFSISYWILPWSY